MCSTTAALLCGCLFETVSHCVDWTSLGLESLCVLALEVGS